MLTLLAPVVHREDGLSPLGPAQPTRFAPRRRRHSISTSTLQHKLPTAANMADHTPTPLARMPLRPPTTTTTATTTSTLTLPMPTPSRPTPSTRKIAAELRRHSFRIASTSAGPSAALPPKPTAASSTSAATVPARSPVKVLCAAPTAVRIHTADELKSVPVPPQNRSSEQLPILRFESVARDVRVSVGSSWKLPRAERKHLKLTTSPEPFLTVFCSATAPTKFVLPADTVVEHTLETLKVRSSSDAALRLKIRFATGADAAIWQRLVRDALAQAAWRRAHEDVACLSQTPASRVLVARHTVSGTESVVKTHLRARVDDVAEVALLRRLVPLAHAHAPLAFLRGYRVVETARDVEIVMPRHAGRTLLASLSARAGPVKAMREREARRVVEQIAETLRALHASGLVHCDLKLENVLLADDGDVCVIDFGGAFDAESNDKQQHAARMVGTPGYIAPERVRHVDQPPTPAADVFSLGILLFQMLVGQHPFAKAQAARRRLTIEDSLSLDWAHMERRLQERNVSPEAQQLVAQLTAADPRARISLDRVLNHAWFSNQSA